MGGRRGRPLIKNNQMINNTALRHFRYVSFLLLLGFIKFKSNQILGRFEFDQIKLILIWIWFDSNIWIWIWFEFEFLIVIFKSNQIFVKSNQIWPDLNLIKSNIVKFEFGFDQIFDSNIWRSNQIAEPYLIPAKNFKNLYFN